MSKNLVKITEVGPRDGLQNEKEIISTEDKLALIETLVDAGVKNIEVSSFVSPKWVPQLGDAADLFASLKKKEGVRYLALVPNLKGLERALQSGVTDIALFTAASDTFNKKNINRSVDESLEDIQQILKELEGKNTFLRIYLSTIFECPYAGKMDLSKVSDLIKRIFDLGVDELSLGDTIGTGTPLETQNLLASISDLPKEKIALHFHDTYGRALANSYQALNMGYRHFDSSVAGLGGCPYAKGASGNLATEDLVSCLHAMGFDTGIDLEAYCQNFLELKAFQNRTFSGRYLTAFSAQC